MQWFIPDKLLHILKWLASSSIHWEGAGGGGTELSPKNGCINTETKYLSQCAE